MNKFHEDVPNHVFVKAMCQAINFMSRISWPRPEDDIWLTISPSWDLNIIVIQTPEWEVGVCANLHEVIDGKTKTDRWIRIMEYVPIWRS